MKDVIHYIYIYIPFAAPILEINDVLLIGGIKEYGQEHFIFQNSQELVSEEFETLTSEFILFKEKMS